MKMLENTHLNCLKLYYRSDSLEVGVCIKRVQIGLEDLKAHLVLVLEMAMEFNFLGN